MIDIHHHLLFGLDDGAPDLATSVEMCKLAAADGITHIVATPHANSHWPFTPAANLNKLNQIRAALPPGLNLTLGLGCDFHLSFDNIEEAKLDPAKFSINGGGYLLVELPDYGIPSGVGEILYELRLAGLTPILTHPERNPTLQKDYERLANWLRSDLLVQLTADSVTGRRGKTVERMSCDLLERGWVHFIATDAHNLDRRPPRMSEAHDLIAKKYGAETAHRLCVTNPRAAFDGHPLPPQPEPTQLFQSEEDKPWWRRILDRY